MVFECQRDSYKSEFTTKVVSCEECGPKEYEIVLEDTILFPEGGGQVSFFDHSLFIWNQGGLDCSLAETSVSLAV
jgi:Ser-tRNA(Ala) deacylase AlaX